MAESLLDGHYVRSGFIQMQSESMTAAVKYRSAVREACTADRAVKDVAYRLTVNAGGRLLTREKPIPMGGSGIRPVDVIDQNTESFFGKDGIPFRAVLGSGNKDAFLGHTDIATMEVT